MRQALREPFALLPDAAQNRGFAASREARFSRRRFGDAAGMARANQTPGVSRLRPLRRRLRNVAGPPR